MKFYPYIPPSTICNITISKSDVYDVLTSLNPTKAMGIDGIGPKVLKSCVLALYQPIHHLIVLSLTQHYLPKEWRYIWLHLSTSQEINIQWKNIDLPHSSASFLKFWKALLMTKSFQSQFLTSLWFQAESLHSSTVAYLLEI